MKKIIDLLTFKKLDWYVLRSYVGPFILTFIISWFVLVMQFLWKYVDDMIGKGIDFQIVGKFIYYTSATLIPMALPLAILLSSIMTMGKFGEHFELTAAKASGISIFRFFKSMIFFSILISIFAFYFSNFILTKAKVIADTMLADIRTLKPAVFIKPKTFYNGLSGASIRVDSKDEKTGILYGVKIYNHSAGSGRGNGNVLLAKTGRMIQSEDGKILILRLDSGIQYTEDASSTLDNVKFPFKKIKFDTYEKRFDLTQFKLNDNFGKNGNDIRFMLNIKELNFHIDSLKKEGINRDIKYDTNFSFQNYIARPIVSSGNKISLKDSINRLSKEEQDRFKIILTNKLRNVKNNLYVYSSERTYISNQIALFDIEWHRKFTLAIACLVLFFVGAPLGAIIKKGGIGLPMFLSVILFILFYFTGLIGVRIAESFKVSPFIGMWLSTFIFLPLGMYLTYKAKNDSALLNTESYTQFYGKMMRFFDKKLNKQN